MGNLSSGDGPIEGWQGSYCWQGTCADMAELPDKTDLPELEASPGGGMVFALSDQATFVAWTISYGDGEGDLTLLEEGGQPFDPDARPTQSPAEIRGMSFDGPPAGDWALLIGVRFPGGDLSYAWHVVVE